MAAPLRQVPNKESIADTARRFKPHGSTPTFMNSIPMGHVAITDSDRVVPMAKAHAAHKAGPENLRGEMKWLGGRIRRRVLAGKMRDGICFVTDFDFCEQAMTMTLLTSVSRSFVLSRFRQ